MSDDTRPYKAGFEAMHERMHGGAAMDTLENAQKRAEYWKAEHLAANAEIERLRAAITALADTELRELACIGSNAPVEDALGRLFALVPNVQADLTGAASCDRSGRAAGYATEETE